MRKKSSASRPARGSERRAATVAALLLALTLGVAGLAPGPAVGQAQPAVRVLVVDLDAALRESAASRALREAELAARAELQSRFDALQAELEDEEAEMVRLRQITPRAEFDKLVVAFDQKVRAARRDAQQSGAALQARFAEAQTALAALARPMLDALMTERGAVMVIDRKATLAVAPALDVTEALLERLNARQPNAEGLIPPESGSTPGLAPVTP